MQNRFLKEFIVEQIVSVSSLCSLFSTHIKCEFLSQACYLAQINQNPSTLDLLWLKPFIQHSSCVVIEYCVNLWYF